jgi:hypothetical protein
VLKQRIQAPVFSLTVKCFRHSTTGFEAATSECESLIKISY